LYINFFEYLKKESKLIVKSIIELYINNDYDIVVKNQLSNELIIDNVIDYIIFHPCNQYYEHCCLIELYDTPNNNSIHILKFINNSVLIPEKEYKINNKCIKFKNNQSLVFLDPHSQKIYSFSNIKLSLDFLQVGNYCYDRKFPYIEFDFNMLLNINNIDNIIDYHDKIFVRDINGDIYRFDTYNFANLSKKLILQQNNNLYSPFQQIIFTDDIIVEKTLYTIYCDIIDCYDIKHNEDIICVNNLKVEKVKTFNSTVYCKLNSIIQKKIYTFVTINHIFCHIKPKYLIYYIITLAFPNCCHFVY
jgi:hypothetical protein